MTLKILLAAYAALSFGACKRPNISNLASLENYASDGQLNEYSCQGAPSELRSPSVDYFVRSAGQVDDTIARAIRDSVAAVPQRLRELVIELDGQVVVTTNISQFCDAEEYSATSSRIPVACAKYIPADKNGKRILGVFVVPDENIIRRELVRQFGFLFSETISHMRFEAQGNRLAVTSLTHPHSCINFS